MVTRNAKNTGVRMFTAEHNALTAACAAFAGEDWEVTPSFLLDVAALEEALRLGFTPSHAGRERRPPGKWENAPPQLEECFSERITITLPALHLEAIAAAARWAGLEVPRFLMGSFWRFLANRQRAEPTNEALQAIEVPEKYRR